MIGSTQSTIAGEPPLIPPAGQRGEEGTATAVSSPPALPKRTGRGRFVLPQNWPGKTAPPAAPQPSASDSSNLWYKSAVIYEVHVRAFQDSNGDGVGDFRGLTSRLDY